jgi:hypothetical protein
MNPKFFYNVVVPTFATEGTAFVGITTLGEDVAGKDEVNRLVASRTEEGRSLFRTIVLDDVCEECKATGNAGSCKHRQGEIPWWQDQKRRDFISQLMSKDHFDTYMRENRWTEGSLSVFFIRRTDWRITGVSRRIPWLPRHSPRNC